MIYESLIHGKVEITMDGIKTEMIELINKMDSDKKTYMENRK